MVSAIKVGGQKLYDLARAGHEVERAPRPITIRSFEVAATSDPLEWDFTVVTSPGTYVRVLAADLAESLGTLGHLTVLRRTASGMSDVAAALSLDEVAQRVRDGEQVLAPPTCLVAHLAHVVLNEQDVMAIRHGKTVAGSGDGEVALLDGAGQLVAIAEAAAGKVKPVVVLPAEGASAQG
jgi:tRNA pseudouridine55 synthase